MLRSLTFEEDSKVVKQSLFGVDLLPNIDIYGPESARAHPDVRGC